MLSINRRIFFNTLLYVLIHNRILDPEGIITRPVVNVSALTLFIRYIYF